MPAPIRQDLGAIVTGAGGVIGAAISRSLAASGYSVALIGRSEHKLQDVAKHIYTAGGEATVVPGDLSDIASLQQVAGIASEKLGRVNVLVNCAAVLAVKPFSQFSVRDFDDHFAVNLRAPFFITQAVLPELRREGEAAIVNVSSTATNIPRAGSALYGASKAALEYWTRCLAAELASDRIRVNALQLGPVDTPILNSWLPEEGEKRERLVTGTPLGRLNSVEEIAWWVKALCGPNSAWVTGAVIPIDGGKGLGAAESYV